MSETACKSQDCSDNPAVRMAILQLLDWVFDTPPAADSKIDGKGQPGSEPDNKTKTMENPP